MWIAASRNPNAASSIASGSVGWAWVVQARSSAVSPICTASAPSAIKIGGVRPHHVDPEDSPAARLANQPDQPVGLAEDACFGVGREGELRDLHVRALPRAWASVKPDAGDLRPGEDDVGHRAVVDLPLSACRVLRGDPALDHRLVGQHPAADRIADGPDVGQIRLQAIIDGDGAAVHAQPDFGEAQPLGVRPAAGGDQDSLALEDRLAAGSRGDHPERVAMLLDPLDRTPVWIAMPRRRSRICSRFAIASSAPVGQDRRRHFQDGHLAAQGLVDAGELQPMTPPPMTTSRAGTVDVQRSVLVTTPGSRGPRSAVPAVTEPGARMTWVP